MVFLLLIVIPKTVSTLTKLRGRKLSGSTRAGPAGKTQNKYHMPKVARKIRCTSRSLKVFECCVLKGFILAFR